MEGSKSKKILKITFITVFMVSYFVIFVLTTNLYKNNNNFHEEINELQNQGNNLDNRVNDLIEKNTLQNQIDTLNKTIEDLKDEIDCLKEDANLDQTSNNNRKIKKGNKLYGNEFCNGHVYTELGWKVNIKCEICERNKENINRIPGPLKICYECAELTGRCETCGKLIPAKNEEQPEEVTE